MLAYCRSRYAYYYCRQKCSSVIARKATLEEQFVELLRQLVPSPKWLELLKQTILSIWHNELGQVSDLRESVQKRVTLIRGRLRRLDEAFLYESSVDRSTYEEHRDKLREELTLAELELSEARVEQFDIDSALTKAISVLNNASALWIDASLDDRLRLQEVLFPQGLEWDGKAFQTPVTCLSFYNLAPIERSGAAPRLIDGTQTPPISLASNELSSESQAGVNDGTPSIANFKPQPAWRSIRQWLEAMQLIPAASKSLTAVVRTPVRAEDASDVRDDFRDSDA